MVQVNEETGNRRPIMLSLPTKDEKPKSKEEKMETQKKETDSNDSQIKRKHLFAKCMVLYFL